MGHLQRWRSDQKRGIVAGASDRGSQSGPAIETHAQITVTPFSARLGLSYRKGPLLVGRDVWAEFS